MNIPNDFCIYVLSFDEATFNKGKTFFTSGCFKHNIIPSTKYLENVMYTTVLENLYNEWSLCKYVGTLSYRAPDKVCNLKNILAKHQEMCDEDYDVIALWTYNNKRTLIDQGNMYHNKFEAIWVCLLTKMGYEKSDIISKDVIAYFGNYWIAKPKWMLDYICFFKKAQKILEYDEDQQEWLNLNSHYPKRIPIQRCIEIFGKPYHTYHPFICERLSCFYFWKHGAKIKVY